MTRLDIRPGELRFLYVVVGILLGVVLSAAWGRYVDRDRDQAIQEIYQFIDGDRIELQADTVWHTSPMRVRPDPGNKEGK